MKDRDIATQFPDDNASTNAYYSRLWTSEKWCGPSPNSDERSRLKAIEELIRRHVQKGEPLEKILDVGCGRGWLTNYLNYYGNAQGLEVVPDAVEMARSMFPDIEFSIANPVTMSKQEVDHFGNADLVVTSEVIEHVANTEKVAFLQGLASLVKPGGYVIITTPRGEFWKQWRALGTECQPVEEWITEVQLTALCKTTGLDLVAKTRIYLYGHDYHAATAWLLRGQIFPRLLRLVKPLYNAILKANGFYQVALFRKKHASTS